jgi:hypothetical protein
VLIAVAGWLVITAVVGLLAWGLARSAAVGDQDELEQLTSARAVEAEARARERREGPEDRRAEMRPWTDKVLGRRAEDVLRQDLTDAHRALRDAEERLAEIEARRSA